jgi:AraC-like DNA-binding protein
LKRSSPRIQNVGYANPRGTGFGIEVMRLSELFARVDQGHFVAPQRPQFHLLFLVTAGRGQHRIDFRIHECRVGTVLHVRPGQVQQFLRDRKFEAIVILFPPEFVLPDQALAQLSGLDSLLDHVLPSGCLQREPGSGRIASDFERLEQEYVQCDGALLGVRIIQHLLNALLLRLAASGGAGEREPVQFIAASRTVARFQRELERRVGQSNRVRDYANWLNCSPKTLHANCMAVRGRGPKAIIEQRVALEAQRLLAHTALSVEEIAGKLNFTEAANFARMFRRVTGTTPGRFRTEHSGL